MSFISYSQNFEDVLLWRALGHLERGTYLDIGAQDPVHDSVSLAFYNAGWRGTHVEPTSYYAARLREARSDEAVIQAAVSGSAGPMDFYEFPDTGLSTGRNAIAQRHIEHGFPHRTLKVPTVRLSDLLQQTGEVQWLKVDVEGMEADVLQSWDNCPIRPWVMVIEATLPNSQQQTHEEWEQLVTCRGYMEVHFDGLSRFFVHSAHQELAEKLGPGPNIFDGFSVTERHFTARLLVDGAAQERAAAEERALALTEQARVAEQRAGALEQQFTATNAELERLKQSAEEAHEAAAAARSRAETLSVQHIEAVHALAAAETDHRRTVEQCTETLGRVQAELLEMTKARVGDQHEHRRLALEVQQNLRDAEAWRKAVEGAETELQRQTQRWEKQVEAAQAQLGVLRDQTNEQMRAFADDRATMQAQIARLEQSLALEANQNLHNADAWRQAAEAKEAELQREKLQREAQEQASQAELVIVRDQFQQQREAYAEDRARLEAEMSRLHHIEAIVAELNLSATSLQQKLSEANQTIANALAQPTGRWQRLGRALGFARDDSARTALRSWLKSQQITTIPLKEVAMNLASPNEARNPYLPANSLRELLSWHGVDFVRCAYVTLLGRPPEPKGEMYYADRVNRGVPKLLILQQIRNSKEGRAFDCGLAELDAELAKAARARWPFVGALFPDSEVEPQRISGNAFRSLGNQIGLLHARFDQLNDQFSAREGYNNHEPPNHANCEPSRVPAEGSHWVTIENILAMFEVNANG